MGRLTIYKDKETNSTAISNTFIDEYMQEANGAQLKIYLFLVRMMNAHLATSISDMADKFNLTEKDVIRALKFWENMNLLVLEYDAKNSLSGIHLLPIENRTEYETSSEEQQLSLSQAPVLSFIQNPQSATIQRNAIQYTTSTSELFNTHQANQMNVAPSYGQPSTPIQQPAAIEKPNYTPDDLNRFHQNADFSQLTFIAEQYIKKSLTATDLKTLMFIYDTLHFSVDLIDYLLQYCIEKGKKDFRYIEKVAMAWAEQNITTPEEARATSRFDKNVYSIMQWLGKTTSPSPKEREFIDRWTKTYGFSEEVIKEACDRTVMSTDTRRFNYCDGILTRWAAANVRTREDITSLDMTFQKNRINNTKPTTNYTTSQASNNRFNQFEQNNYDFDELEKQLLSN